MTSKCRRLWRVLLALALLVTSDARAAEPTDNGATAMKSVVRKYHPETVALIHDRRGKWGGFVSQSFQYLANQNMLSMLLGIDVGHGDNRHSAAAIMADPSSLVICICYDNDAMALARNLRRWGFAGVVLGADMTEFLPTDEGGPAVRPADTEAETTIAQATSDDAPPAAAVQATSDDAPPAVAVQATSDDAPPAAAVQATSDDAPPAAAVQASTNDAPPANALPDAASLIDRADDAASSAPRAAPQMDTTPFAPLVVTVHVPSGAYAPPPATIDILGLQLGMAPVQTGEAMMAAGFKKAEEDKQLTVQRRKINGVQIEATGANEYIGRQIFQKHDEYSTEWIDIFFVSPLSGNGAYRIKREIKFSRDEAKPLTSKLVDTLIDKYGIYSQHEGGEQQVSLSGGGMRGFMSGVLGSTRYETFDKLYLWWYYVNGVQMGKSSDLGDTLQVSIIGKNPLVDEVYILLENQSASRRDKDQITDLANRGELLAKSAPRPGGVLPKL